MRFGLNLASSRCDREVPTCDVAITHLGQLNGYNCVAAVFGVKPVSLATVIVCPLLQSVYAGRHSPLQRRMR